MQSHVIGERGRRRLNEVAVQAELLPRLVAQQLGDLEEPALDADALRDALAHESQHHVGLKDSEVRLAVGAVRGLGEAAGILAIDQRAPQVLAAECDQPVAFGGTRKALENADAGRFGRDPPGPRARPGVGVHRRPQSGPIGSVPACQ